MKQKSEFIKMVRIICRQLDELDNSIKYLEELVDSPCAQQVLVEYKNVRLKKINQLVNSFAQK